MLFHFKKLKIFYSFNNLADKLVRGNNKQKFFVLKIEQNESHFNGALFYLIAILFEILINTLI